MRAFLPFLCFCVVLRISAQSTEFNLENFRGMSMRHIGPAAMSGRVTGIDVLLDNTKVIYATTASGGLWLTENGGSTWKPIFDDQPTLCLGAVKVQQSNPDVIWVGTGEGNPRNSQSSGKGIFKSIDGGKTWAHMGLTNTHAIHRIVIHRDNPDIVWAAALGSAWGPNPERGVFKTTDGGKTWNKVLFKNDLTGCAELVTDPANPEKLIAAMWEYKREPWFFNSGGKGSGLYISHDGGETWSQRTSKDGLPEGELGRMGLAISASNPKVVYALIESKELALYKSTDGGVKWVKMSSENVGNRPFYYAEILVNPSNENEVWSLWSAISRSIDGGKTFENVVGYWDIHPDHHALWINPNDSRHIINGNDGGLNISRDGGANWEYMTHLPLGQFYHISTDNEIPYNVYGGMQDNGSWVGPGYVWHHGGIRNEDWKEIHFGDGFDVAPHPTNPQLAYGMSQGGNVYCINIDNGHQQYIKPVHPGGEKLRFNWNAALATDPHHPDGLYFGSQYLHHSSDRGISWTIISPDLTTNNPDKLKQAESGGLTKDVTTAENHCTLLCIAPNPMNASEIWVGTDDGNLQLTRDDGKTWTNLTPKIKAMPKNAWIPQIRLSVHNQGEAFVVVNNYRQNDRRPMLFHTKDYGMTWVNLLNEKAVDGFCHTVLQDTKVPELLFLGTEQGLYFSIDYGKKWHKWTLDYPSVPTIDLSLQERENDLVIGTFGRAAYVLDNITPLRLAAKSKGIFPQNKITALPSPDSYIVAYAQPSGARFVSDHHFSGANKSPGQLITYHLSPAFVKEKVTPDKKDVTIKILNQANDTLRTFTAKADSGITCVHWNFDTNGSYWPGWGERKTGENPPGGGPRVLPGRYKAIVAFAETSDTVWFQVNPDPRVPYISETAVSNLEIQRQFQQTIALADRAFERTKAANKILNNLKSLAETTDAEKKKELISSVDTLIQQLKVIQEKFMLPQKTVGYVDSSEKLASLLGQASSYLWSNMQPIGQNGVAAINIASARTAELSEEVAAFVAGPFATIQKQVNEIGFDPFKDFSFDK